jgi:hypothetical protein
MRHAQQQCGMHNNNAMFKLICSGMSEPKACATICPTTNHSFAAGSKIEIPFKVECPGSSI